MLMSATSSVQTRACMSNLCDCVDVCVFVLAGGSSSLGVRQMASVDRSLLNWLAALLTLLHATLTQDHSQYLRK